MRLRILHTTTYTYARDVDFNPHRLMLRPRGSQDVQVLHHALHISPSADIAWMQDVFGNLVATAEFRERASTLAVTSELHVDATAQSWPVFPISPRAQFYPFEYSSEELVDLGALRAPPNHSSTVRLWAERFIHRQRTDTLALLKDLNTGVMASTAYRPREEEGVQSGAETLSLACGSCRDFAALFIEAVRHLGFAARAVSGYLFDPQTLGGQAEDTTHAWADVYLPGAGWIAFDPTHARVGGAGLISVAVGRCNAQIMPVAGSYAGAPDDRARMTVTVGVTASDIARTDARDEVPAQM